MTKKLKWYLDETELTIFNSKNGNYNLETLADIKSIIGKLNHYEDYIENLKEYLVTKESEINSLEETNDNKLEAINTMENVYHLKSKENDFNTQIIALIKLDCIKEIKQQYRLIKLRDEA